MSYIKLFNIVRMNFIFYYLFVLVLSNLSLIGYDLLPEELQEKALIKVLTCPDPITIIFAEVPRESLGTFLVQSYTEIFLSDCL